MEESNDRKRKTDKYIDKDEFHKERRSKKQRSRTRSPRKHHDNAYRESYRKRNHSRSRSPKRRRSTDEKLKSEEKKDVPQRKAKETDMLNTRTGGAYIPPARLRMMQEQITDKSSVAYQRLAWEALKKSIHGHINKINVGNIGIIIKELLKENIVRGRGLLCRSVIQAQAASPTFTNVYAALVAAVNSRFPNIGELLLKRLVIQFKRGFKRNDKAICISSASFIAHLVNQRVAHEILALELLTLLVETPTDDSVEVAIAFLKECGQKLTEVSSKGVNAIFEMLRNILHEGQLDKRVQYMIEVMFQVWKDGFKDHPAVIEELELVPEEEQFTHLLMLDEATDSQDILNVFKFDDKYEDNEQKYKNLSKEILGSDAESGEEGSDGTGSDESEEDEEENKPVTIIDNTETNLVALRRTIYLTINSSLDFEECAHKLMKMQLKPGQEVELCHMFLDCCAEQRTYEKFYGLLAQRFCNINRIYIGPFEDIFKDSYSTAHRLDTNRLRNVSKFFAHLLFTDSISWEVMDCVKLNEEDTTSSSRIYIKILFQELAEYMGLKKLNDRLKDPTLQDVFSGVFPRDNPKNTRFSINFFTSIGLGGLTDELREHLKQMPKNVPAPVAEIKLDSESSSDSSSSCSSSSSDSSSSDSEGSSEDEEARKKKKSKNTKSPKRTQDNKPESNPRADDKVERWGHDGFYETYGDTVANPKRNNDPQRNRNNKDGNNRPYQNRSNTDRIGRRGGSEEKDRYWANQDSRQNNVRYDDRTTDSNRRHDKERSGRRDVSQERNRERRSDNTSHNQRRDERDYESNRRNGNDWSKGRNQSQERDKERRKDYAPSNNQIRNERYIQDNESNKNDDRSKRRDVSQERDRGHKTDDRSKHQKQNHRHVEDSDEDRYKDDRHKRNQSRERNVRQDEAKRDNDKRKRRDGSPEREKIHKNDEKSKHQNINDRYIQGSDVDKGKGERNRYASQDRERTIRDNGSTKDNERRKRRDVSKGREKKRKNDDKSNEKNIQESHSDRDSDERKRRGVSQDRVQKDYERRSNQKRQDDRNTRDEESNKRHDSDSRNRKDTAQDRNEEPLNYERYNTCREDVKTGSGNRKDRRNKDKLRDIHKEHSNDDNRDEFLYPQESEADTTKEKSRKNASKLSNDRAKADDFLYPREDKTPTRKIKKSKKSKKSKRYTKSSSESDSSDTDESKGKEKQFSESEDTKTERSRENSEPPELGRYWDNYDKNDKRKEKLKIR